MGIGAVVLIGFMGAGKTSVGQALASRFGWELFDTDAMVEQEAGMTIDQIFVRDGEVAFRAREAEAVAKACSGSRRVIACGGGAVLALRNFTLLKQTGMIVYLRASPEELLRRLGGGEGRPLLGADPKRAVPRMVTERAPAYETAADFIVDVDDRSPELVVDAIEVEMAGRAAERSKGRPR